MFACLWVLEADKSKQKIRHIAADLMQTADDSRTYHVFTCCSSSVSQDGLPAPGETFMSYHL